MHCHGRFTTFLQAISPSPEQRKEMQKAHIELRTKLEQDELVKPNLVETFIQGSYRRHTGLLGSNDHPCDVDVVVVTRVPSSLPPTHALDLFKPFLEKNYKGRYKQQSRSWCISYSDHVKMDLVPTSAPSEAWKLFFEGNRKTAQVDFDFQDPEFVPAEQGKRKVNLLVEAFKKVAGASWQEDPLEIPDRDAKKWTKTHPLAQIEWTTEKNGTCNGHYTNVVRAIKWWKRTKAIDPKYPKGYPLEHLVGCDCPPDIPSIAEGLTRALEELARKYGDLAMAGRKPVLPDHGVPSHDVLDRVESQDFCAYYTKAAAAAKAARAALDDSDDVSSARKWHALLGPAYPKPDDDADGTDASAPGGGGFTARTAPSTFVKPQRFA